MSLFLHLCGGFFTGYFTILAAFNTVPIDFAYPLGWVGAVAGALAYFFHSIRLPLYTLAFLIWVTIPISIIVSRNT